MSACPGCDGSGWYTPRFSATALVECLTCNRDWSKPPPGWTVEQWNDEDAWNEVAPPPAPPVQQQMAGEGADRG